MPDTRECRDRRLETMSDEALRQLLREDASKPEGEDSDMERMLQVMEVLATRRKERGEGRSPAEALDSFNKNYSTNKQNNLISEKVREPKTARRLIVWKRIAAMAAALALVVMVGSVSAGAWDFDLWEIISEWTKETFRFGTYGEAFEQNADNPCASLQAALDRFDIGLNLVPTWLPDGYEEVYTDIQETPKQRRFFASYQCDDREIFIRITDYLGKDPFQSEQSGTLLETYESNNITYFIFENNSLIQAAWTNENFECFIQGSLTLDEIRFMIDSIEKG